MFRLGYDVGKNEFSFKCKRCDSVIRYKNGEVVPLHCPTCKTLVATRPDQLYESTYYRRGYYMSNTYEHTGGL